MDGKNDFQPKPVRYKPQAGWQRPVGVSVGNWDYLQSGQIAKGYEEFLKDDPLTQADGGLVARYLPQCAQGSRQKLVVDFGCGVGRSLIPVMRRGYGGIGIDLSAHMLMRFAEKWQSKESGPNDQAGDMMNPHLIQANLVELDSIASGIADVGLCMFSTLGMIQHQSNRRSFLAHASRIIRPDGLLILHAHNFWFQIASLQGIGWFVRQFFRSWIRGKAMGDRTADYRGLKNVLIHSYRRSELVADLEAANWEPIHWHGVRPGSEEATDGLPWFSSIRLVGWVVVCRPINRS